MTRIKRIILILLTLCTAVILFACNGSSEGSGDKTPPVITLAEQPYFYAEEKAALRIASATDNVDGDVAVTFSLYAPSGKEIGTSGGRFVPHEVGDYKIVFYAVDKSGNAATLEQTLTVFAGSAKPTVELGDYAVTAREGELYSIPSHTVTEAGKNIDVTVAVTGPDGGDVSVVGGKFLVDLTGTYSIGFGAVLSSGIEIEKEILVTASYGDKTVDGVDGNIDDAMYDGVKSTILGGLRELESIYVKTVRTSSGIFMAFDASEDKRVNGNERIELFFAADEYARTPANGTKKLELYTSGSVKYYEYMSGVYRSVKTPEYRYRAVYAVKPGAGTTLAAGNTDDNGYASELFVPYAYLGVGATDNIYLTLGCVREGDSNNWDGWNEFPIFADPLTPYKYVELRPNGYLFNDNRLYHNAAFADGKIDDAKYSGTNAVHTSVGGLRNLEGMNVSVAHGETGLYFAFSVSGDKKVNDFDRVEVCLNAGGYTRNPNASCLQFWIQSNGAMTVLRGNGVAYVGFDATTVLPAVAYSYGDKTTPNDNTDEDNGYYIELYVPYAMFDEYTAARGVNKDTRLGITFGIWRVSESSHVTLSWQDDPNKDWDGWSYGEFCDPLFPDTYAVLMPGGRILTRREVVDILADPTDPSVDGELDEAYWNNAGVLEITPVGELDGLTTKLYRDTQGLRVAFVGEVKRFSMKDAIAFYVSTRDSSYTIGGTEYVDDDSYEVYGQYASMYDYRFDIWLDRSAVVYRGKYKDWAEQISDLSAVSLDIVKTEHGFVAEMYLPYSFFTAPDGYAPDKDSPLGVSVRLAGENDRGSTVWNNLHYAGIYADSESPASYVRIDKDNNIFGAVRNAAEMRVDGSFDEAVYSGSHAELAFGASNIKLYRANDGLYGRLHFGDGEDSISLVVSTLDHGLAAPYVYDYLITVYRDGRVESSFGNSHAFYDPSIYSSYCAPRAVFDGADAELLIPYDYLSRYNTTDKYGERGYMRITADSSLKVAAACGRSTDGECTYNGTKTTFDLLDPATYVVYSAKENQND